MWSSYNHGSKGLGLFEWVLFYFLRSMRSRAVVGWYFRLSMRLLSFREHCGLLLFSVQSYIFRTTSHPVPSQVLVGGLTEEVQQAPLPIIHHQPDLLTCKVSGNKFFGAHVFWVDRNFEMKDALLSVSGPLPFPVLERTRFVFQSY